MRRQRKRKLQSCKAASKSPTLVANPPHRAIFLIIMRIVGGANRIRTERSNDEFMMFKPFFHQSVPDVQREIRGRGISNVGNVGQFILIMTRAMMSNCAHSIQMRSFSYSNIIFRSYFGSGNLSRRFSSEVNLNRHNNDYPKSFCQWLAGVIDGDGYLRLAQGRYPVLSITMGIEDVPLLHYLKETLGTGGITKVPGAKAFQYRISNREGMKKVILCINGIIRNSKRLPQLRRVCEVLNIPVIEPIELTDKSHWFAGFWDADGSIGFYGLPKRAPWISISVSNKFESDLAPFLCFGGNIYYNKGHDVHEWVVSKRTEVLRMLAYYNENLFRSRKSRRFRLIEEYFQLKDSRAYRLSSPHYQSWLAFEEKWKNFLI